MTADEDKGMRVSCMCSDGCYSLEKAATALWEWREAPLNSCTQEPFWTITPPSSAAACHICLGNGAAAGVWVEPGQSHQGERYLGGEAWTSLKSHCVSVDGAVRAFSVFREGGNTRAFHSQLIEQLKKQSVGPDPKHQVWMCSSYNAW